MNVQRSIAFSVIEKYSVYLLTLLGVVIVGRLLSPADFGLFAIAFAVANLTDTLRDFGTGNYLIQAPALTPQTLRVAFTVTFALSAGCALLLALGASLVADWYGEPALVPMMLVLAANCLVVPLSLVSLSAMRRSMAFGRLARINIIAAVANIAAVIALALAGFGAMSFAWAMLVASVVRAVAANLAAPHWTSFRPSVAGWRGLAAFGGTSTATGLINVLYDSLPQLVIGRLLGVSAVGLYGRAQTVCQLPDRLLVGAVQPVILPMLSEQARQGRPLKQPYLTALSHISAVQWPAFVGLALLAEPFVLLLLGPQWTEVPPLVRLIALGSLSLFPAAMTYPTLVALGRIRDTLTMSLISLPPSIAIIAAAATLGLEWVAAAQFINAPLQVYVALTFVRRHLDVGWGEIARAVLPSLVASLFAALPPAAAVALSGFSFAVSVPAMVVAAACAAPAWVAGLAVARHPLLAELTRGARGLAGWLRPAG